MLMEVDVFSNANEFHPRSLEYLTGMFAPLAGPRRRAKTTRNY